MDVRQAFREAARAIVMRSWDRARPDHPPFEVDGKFLSIRQVCERAREITDELPEETKTDLYDIFKRGYLPLQVMLRHSETYSGGADCLLKYMDG